MGTPPSEAEAEEEGRVSKLEVAVAEADVAAALPLEQGGYLTPSDSKPQKRQCWPHSPACQAKARSRGLHSAWVAT